jgi:acetolactate synthase-1/2/3 large subunit
MGMADGFTRMTSGRRTGVFAMQSGPGSENAFPGLATAFADSTPVLVIPQGLPKERAFLPPNFDSQRAFASISKTFERVTAPELLLPALRRAFYQLRTGRPGPVVVEIPGDVGQLDHEGASGYQPVTGARSAADASAVERAVAALAGAARPVILAGAGVLYAEAWDELRELAEALGIPVATTTGGKSSFPEDHPLSAGATGLTMSDPAFHFVRDADVVLAVGASMSRGSTLTANLPPGKVLIHAVNDARDLGKGYYVEHPLLGDAKLILSQFNEAVADRPPVGEPVRGAAASIARVRETWLERWRPQLSSDQVPLNGYRVISDFMEEVPPEDAVVTHDAGGPRDMLLPFYRATRPHSYLGWGKSHALGTGVGLTMGAKCAAPDRLCVHFMGDAAFGMTGLDLETAVRTGLPTLSMVFKNSTMAVERGSLVRSHELYGARDLGGDYRGIAQALGLHAERVEHPADIRPAIQRARRATENGQAALLEFVTSPDLEFSNTQALSK